MAGIRYETGQDVRGDIKPCLKPGGLDQLKQEQGAGVRENLRGLVTFHRVKYTKNPL